jgi:hypothetical protein
VKKRPAQANWRLRKAKTVCLVACCSRKQTKRTPAGDLYQSTLFKKSKAFAQLNGRAWFILSAKHGLLDPAKIIKPYDLSLQSRTRAQRLEWSRDVFASLRRRLRSGDRVVVLAGRLYTRDLSELLERHNFSVDDPLEGRPIGRRLQWLDRIERRNS